MVSIHDRPPEIEERLSPGHWEGDLIKGAHNRSAVGTLVERTTLFTVLARMEDSSAALAVQGFGKAFKRIEAQKRLSMTYAQGKQMTDHLQRAAKFIVPIRIVPGSVASMRTRMDFCASTCPRVKI